MYCKVYDVICHPQAIVHMLLCTFAFATLTSYRFAPLLLMDVATFNKTLGNVVLAATKPYKELLMTLALALIIVFIYTSFGCVPVLDQSVLLVSNARARADHTFLTLGLHETFANIAHAEVNHTKTDRPLASRPPRTRRARAPARIPGSAAPTR